jgi:hypothetical protein
MILTEPFSLNIPIHIEFTLYRYDYIDGMLISRVGKHCKNFSDKEDPNHFKIRKSDLVRTIKASTRLNREFVKESGMKTKANSVFFLGLILNKLPNVEWLSFSISYDKEYTRLAKFENKSVVNFEFNIKEGLVDLTNVFTRSELDEFNKRVISIGLMENKYLQRKAFFQMNALLFFELLALMEIDGITSASTLLDALDPRLEEDNTTLIVKTDYTIY